jgi:hypothetical protein
MEKAVPKAALGNPFYRNLEPDYQLARAVRLWAGRENRDCKVANVMVGLIKNLRKQQTKKCQYSPY